MGTEQLSVSVNFVHQLLHGRLADAVRSFSQSRDIKATWESLKGDRYVETLIFGLG